LTDFILYFGSPDKRVLEHDFSTHDARRRVTVTREILWKSSIATESEVLQMEFYLIVQTRANDPAIG
jgi:hypothetical protein